MKFSALVVGLLAITQLLNISHVESLSNDFSNMLLQVVTENSSFTTSYEIVEMQRGSWVLVNATVPGGNYTINVLSSSDKGNLSNDLGIIEISYSPGFEPDFSNLLVYIIDEQGHAEETGYSIISMSEGRWAIIGLDETPKENQMIQILAEIKAINEVELPEPDEGPKTFGYPGHNLTKQKDFPVAVKQKGRKLNYTSHFNNSVMTLKFKDNAIRKIRLFQWSEGAGVELDSFELAGSVQSYAINPLNISLGEVTATAKGNYLYKCKDWDFTARECRGSWEKYLDITPGENYSFVLDAADPAFIETIRIIEADHLDEDRIFVSNIYNEVKEKDNTWSENISDGHYVRVVFEKALNSSNDITVYARTALSNNSSIEIYEENGNNLIAVIENISDEGWYKVYLTGLNGTRQTFDLKINGAVEFDYIVDPLSVIHYQGWEAGNGGWVDPFGSDSGRDFTRSRCWDDGSLGGFFSWRLTGNSIFAYTEQAFNFTGYTRVDVNFSSYYTSIEAGDTLDLKCDGVTVWSYAADGNEDVWLNAYAGGQSVAIYPTDCTFDDSVTIRFESEFDTIFDWVYLDCLNITGFTPPTEIISVTLNAPTSDPDIAGNGTFLMNCTPITNNVSGAYLAFQYNTSTTAWTDIATSGPVNLTTTAPNPIPDIVNNTMYSRLITGRTAGLYNVRCRLYNSTNSLYSAVQSVTVNPPVPEMNLTKTASATINISDQLTFTIDYEVFDGIATGAPASWGPMQYIRNTTSDEASLQGVFAPDPALYMAFQHWDNASSSPFLYSGDAWEVYTIYSLDGGKTWSNETVITNNSVADVHPYMLLNNNGTFVMLYQHDDGNDYELYMTNSTDGINWAVPWQITDDSYSEDDASLEQDPSGMYYLTYSATMPPDTEKEIYIINSTDLVTWSAPTAITNNALNDHDPNIIFHNGTFYLTWATYVSAPWGNQEIFYSRATDPFNIAQWTANTVRLTDNSPFNDLEPSIFIDDYDQLFITYTSRMNVTPDPGLTAVEIMLANSTIANDNTWTLNQVTNNSVRDTYPGLIQNSEGLYYLFYSHYDGNDLELVMQSKGVAPLDARDVVLWDQVPSNTALVPGSISGGGTEAGGVITWNLGNLTAGRNASVSFNVTINGGLPSGTLISNTAYMNYSSKNGSFVETLNSTSNTAVLNEKCFIIGSPGSYALIKNVQGAPFDASEVTAISWACIKIAASNVDFSCDGFNMTNNGTADAAAIVINGSATINYSNVTIRDCPGITQYERGVYVHFSSQDSVQNSTAYNNTANGFTIFQSTQVNLTDNTAHNNTGAGLDISNSDHITITGTVSYNNSADGFNITSSHNSTFTNNTAYYNLRGFYVRSSSNDNNFTNNTAYANDQQGFNITSSHNNNFTDGRSYNNTLGGYCFATGSTGNTATNTAAYNNRDGFIILEASVGTTLINNTIYSNNRDGIRISDTNDTNLSGNTIYSNTEYGIRMTNASSSDFSDNNITSNAIRGIHFAATSTSNNLTSNYVCFNSLDINNAGADNNGTLDSCDSFSNWYESHKGCTFSCSDLWHRYYGNVNGTIVLADVTGASYIYSWLATGFNVYFVDYDSSINWLQLQAIGRNSTNQTSSNDFEELDIAFSSTSFSDNINATYSTDGTLPIATDNYTVFSRTINYVPIANSTAGSTAFRTGILWDMGDGGTEYSNTLNQSTVWMVTVNSSTADIYGTYDYFIQIPYTLASYEGSNDFVSIYVELQ